MVESLLLLKHVHLVFSLLLLQHGLLLLIHLGLGLTRLLLLRLLLDRGTLTLVCARRTLRGTDSRLSLINQLLLNLLLAIVDLLMTCVLPIVDIQSNARLTDADLGRGSGHLRGL